MLDLEKTTRASFEPRVDEEFAVQTGTGEQTLRLLAVESAGAGHAGRAEPFALRFQGPPGLFLPQGIYELRNAALGSMQFFLVQIGNNAQGSSFEAVFN